ncbi:MAG: GGDEF and EAL domain-containing protein [Alcaligenaceae bacterium]|nr:MAG: GGDEF and EAL domain-containing protein [Alcaligenaceae bacterium]
MTRNGRFEMVSRGFCALFALKQGDVVGQLTSLIHSSQAAYDALSARARPAFMHDGAFTGEIELMRSSGELFWAPLRGCAIVPGDRSKGTIWTFEDSTATRAHRERLAWASTHDSLTGLTNRAAFQELLEA